MAQQSEQGFLQRLLATFKVEAAEHVKAMSDLLLALEQTGPDARPELIENLFREAHSLKGAARAVNQSELEAACQELESALAPLKRGEQALSPPLFDQLYHMVDDLVRLARGESGPPPAAPAEARIVPEPGSGGGETVRIATAKLGALLNQAEELLSFKFSSSHLLDELAGLSREFSSWKKDWNRVSREMRALRRNWERHKNSGREPKTQPLLDKMLDVMEHDELRIKTLEEKLARLTRTTEQERHAVGGMVDGLLTDMKQTLMLPFASLFELFPKLVRDLAKNSGKEAELKIEGAAIEIDRRILEQMKDPLIHLLRNSVDHGVELPEERSALGKPVRAQIELKVSPKDGNKVELVVADDGVGIRTEHVRQAAERQGRLEPGAAVDRQALFDLLFESGFSTSPIITDISGRGLGLAIVRDKIEKLGGHLELASQEGQGVRFCITLPTTLATFRGLLVRLDERHYVLPSANVERVVRVKENTIRTVENRETIELAGEVVALVWLADVLELPRSPRGDPSAYVHVVVLAAVAKRIAFLVDEVIADQEVLVKGLGPQLMRVRNVAAATVLGEGRVVPILNVPDLIKSAVRMTPAATHGVEAPAQAAPSKSLLVVEDSITSRALLKNILESSGYRVTTAVDGIDALTALRTTPFDLVVSDVEMPRMDGFALTTKIRQEAKLKELPVILVTALGSQTDRERGIDVGADAYIVKSSFDQSNLLEVIRRLI